MIDWLKRFVLKPPAYLTDSRRRAQAAIAQDWREILLIDAVILFFLGASVHQIATEFGRGDPGIFDYLKALGIDGAIWILSRAVAKRVLVGDDRKGTKAVLWFGLIVFMLLTTAVNTMYEFRDPYAPEGSLIYSFNLEAMAITSKILASSFLAVIVLFLTFARMILAKNMAAGSSEAQAPKRKRRRAAIIEAPPVVRAKIEPDEWIPGRPRARQSASISSRIPADAIRSPTSPDRAAERARRAKARSTFN